MLGPGFEPIGLTEVDRVLLLSWYCELLLLMAVVVVEVVVVGCGTSRGARAGLARGSVQPLSASNPVLQHDVFSGVSTLVCT